MLQDCVIQALPLSFNSPEGGVLSIAITRCQRHLVAVLDGGCLCMWDMGVNAQMLNLGGGLLQNGHFAIPRLPRQVSPRVLPRPGGEPPQNKFIVRCCFGGLDERFILSGSESGQVRVYSRITQDLLLELPGHQGTVNAVSWNPARPDMFVSCSDDGTVRMWGVENDQTEEMEHDRVLPETTSPAC